MSQAWCWQYVDSSGTGMGWFTEEGRQEFDAEHPGDEHGWRELSDTEVAAFRSYLTQLQREQA